MTALWRWLTTCEHLYRWERYLYTVAVVAGWEIGEWLYRGMTA